MTKQTKRADATRLSVILYVKMSAKTDPPGSGIRASNLLWSLQVHNFIPAIQIDFSGMCDFPSARSSLPGTFTVTRPRQDSVCQAQTIW